MNRKTQIVAMFAATVGLAAIAGSIALADTPSAAPAGEPQLPHGWTMEDMQAMMAAGTPGKMHEHLTKDAGTWNCKTQMWMAPGGEPVSSGGTSIVTPLLDGRFIQVEMNGDMPGMGPYHGLGIYGFDNVSQKFVSIWIDNHGTGMMNGTGEMSEDGKTITWEYTGTCPVTKKPIVLREIDTTTGPNTKTLVMYGPDMKTGEEFKMMSIELTKE